MGRKVRKVRKDRSHLSVVRVPEIPVTTGNGVEQHFRMNEAAAILGVSRATLYRWLPQIRHSRIPAAGLMNEIILIPESALAAFLSRYEHKPKTMRKLSQE